MLIKKIPKFQTVRKIGNVNKNFTNVIGQLCIQEIDFAKIFSWRDSDGKMVLWHATDKNNNLLIFLLDCLRSENIEEVDFHSCIQLAIEKGDPIVLDSFLNGKNKILTASSEYCKALQQALNQSLQSGQVDMISRFTHSTNGDIAELVDYKNICNVLLQKMAST
jgi:hypothetical protein